MRVSCGSYTESSEVPTVSVSVWETYSTNRSVIGTAGNTTSWTRSVGLVPSAMRRLGSQVRIWTVMGSRGFPQLRSRVTVTS